MLPLPAYLALNEKEFDIRAQYLLNQVIKLDKKNSCLVSIGNRRGKTWYIGKADLYSAERYFVLGDTNLASFHAKDQKIT